MTRATVGLLFLFVISLQGFAQQISLTDFRIPESRYGYLLGNLSGSFGSNRSAGIDRFEDKSQNGTYNARLNHLSGYDSENSSWHITTYLDGSYNKQSSSSRAMNSYWSFFRNSKSSTQHAYLSSSGQYSSYLSPDKFYVYGSASLNGDYYYNSNRSDTSDVEQDALFNKIRQAEGTVGGGFGIGKMREAHTVFSVVRIIEKLNEDGYLTRELSKEELLEIVEIYTKQIEYNTRYDRPEKYFLDDLLRKLETFGVLKDDRATAYEVARVAEVFRELIFRRMVGWTIQGGFVIGRNQSEESRAQNYTSNPEWNSSNRIIWNSDQTAVDISAQYGYPFSLSLHWEAQASLTIPISSKQKKTDQYLHSALYYQLGERFSNELNFTFTKFSQYRTSGNVPDISSSINELSIENISRLFIENNVNFFVSIGYRDNVQLIERAGITPDERYTNGGFTVRFGVNYRFY